jgi:tetratricopeptide (TPR) repeat protein
MKNIIVLMMLSMSLWAVNTQQLLQAHKEALKVYQTKDRDFYKSIEILRKAGIQKILDDKPKDMSKQDYIHLLNDYGFFLSLTKIENLYVFVNYCEAKQALEKVKALDPNRIPVYLNLGDLYWKLFLAWENMTAYNTGVMRKFQDSKCMYQEEPTYPYMAKQMYLKYAKQMKTANKEEQIPKRLDFILNNDKMFVLTHDYRANYRNATFHPCQDYITALNSLPEAERTYCNRDISKVETPFKVVDWKDVEEKIRKRYHYLEWINVNYSDNVAFKYKNKLCINADFELWQRSLYGNYMVKGCKYKYLDLNLKHFIYPSCETKGEKQ